MGMAMTKVALVLLSLTAGGVYATHFDTLPSIIGVAAFLTLVMTLVPGPSHQASISPRVSILAAAVVAALGLALVWATTSVPEGPAHIIHDLGWTEVALGAWLTYASVIGAWSLRPVKSKFDDAARERWRSGDLAFGADLASHIIVGAQASWAALVVETAWPEPRPELVTELLGAFATASKADMAAMRDRMRDKGGTELAEARWELVRIACDVVDEARAREREDVGGVAVGRFVLAAARVVRDDEGAVRLYAALVLPAIARRA